MTITSLRGAKHDVALGDVRGHGAACVGCVNDAPLARLAADRASRRGGSTGNRAAVSRLLDPYRHRVMPGHTDEHAGRTRERGTVPPALRARAADLLESCANSHAVCAAVGDGLHRLSKATGLDTIVPVRGDAIGRL